MMRSVALKLSLFYLAIIMALSVGFSVAIYSISSRELAHHDPPRRILTQLDLRSRADFETMQLQRETDARHHLQTNLITLNVLTLIGGAMLSYALARRTLEPIEEAFIAQGRFTADASHELRTPLTAMQTMIEVGLRNPNLTLKQAKELMGGTLEEVQKLSTLANGLLKLTRSGQQDMPKEPLQLTDIIEESIEQLALAAKNKHITLANAAAPLTVPGDRVGLKEVVTILLDNAIKYSRADTTVTISTRSANKHGYIVVADQGQGIKPDDIEHIFDRFYRADASRTREDIEGYGLGLSIAKKVVASHGGSIDVKSKSGEGSTFTVKLPLADISANS